MLTGLYRAVDHAVHAAGGAVLHMGQEHASAVFPAGRDAARACARALTALGTLQEDVRRIGQGLDDHWKAALHVAISAHVGPALLDPAELSTPGSKIAVAVGPVIDEIDGLRAYVASQHGGTAVSEALLQGAGQNADAWGDPVETGRIAARFRPQAAPAPAAGA